MIKREAHHSMKTFKDIFHPDKVVIVGSEGIGWKEFLNINPVELF